MENREVTMEEEVGDQSVESSNVSIQEMQMVSAHDGMSIIQEDVTGELGEGETITISLEDAAQIILQEQGVEGGIHEAVQISPGTYQILTHESIQISGHKDTEVGEEVTQIEVPMEMLQEAVEMLQSQDIQGEVALEAAIAKIAARHMAASSSSGHVLDNVEGTTEEEGSVDNLQLVQAVLEHDHEESGDHILEINLPHAEADPTQHSPLQNDSQDLIHTVTSLPPVVTVTSQKHVTIGDGQRSNTNVVFSAGSKISDNVHVQAVSLESLKSLQVVPRTKAVSLLKSIPQVTNTGSTSALPSWEPPLASSASLLSTTLPVTSPANSLSVSNISQSTVGGATPVVYQATTAVSQATETVNQTATLVNSLATKVKPTLPVAKRHPPTPKQPETPAGLDKKPDYDNPIEIKENLEVTVGCKKCIVLPNPDTGQLCIYQLIPTGGKRKRGRPKKEIKVESVENPEESQDAWEDKENWGECDDDTSQDVPPDGLGESHTDAAESLLELSNTGPDGVRRSSRKRKKVSTLKDYAVLKATSSDEESLDDDEDMDFKMSDLDLTSDDELEQDSDDDDYTPTGPRKKYKPKEIGWSEALILAAGGKRGRGRPRRYPLPGQPAHPAQIPAVIVPTANGQTIMIQGLHTIQALQQKKANALPTLMPKPVDGSTDSSQILIVNNKPSDSSLLENGSSTMILGENGLETSLTTVTPGEGTEQEGETTLEIATTITQTPDGQATIIQLPDDVVSMLMKKDPVKLGLKASDIDLEKLKCPKCDFQAYYMHQFKEHINSHEEDIQKCKCCHYTCLEYSELMDHYKETHPKCICSICDYTAEYAYVVKRHMMRHDTEGCSCQICGKIYKDQYILKMHIKMVHMPADVLYECTICGKKFTRKAHLKRHLRIHEPEKPFKCPQCDYRGCEKSDISKHLLIHEDPKYTCEVCGKAFRHIKNKELHVKRHTRQKDYKCGVCGFYGYTFTDIRKHIERKHTDLKVNTTYVCEKCGASFKDDLLLQEHQEQQDCDGMMTFEQALSISTAGGQPGQATIHIPSSVLSADGQHITFDGQQITVDGNQVNITVQQVDLEAEDDEGLILTEEQLAQAQIAVSESQVISATQMVTDLAGAELGHVNQADEVSLDQAVVISAAEAESMIVMS